MTHQPRLQQPAGVLKQEVGFLCAYQTSFNGLRCAKSWRSRSEWKAYILVDAAPQICQHLPGSQSQAPSVQLSVMWNLVLTVRTNQMHERHRTISVSLRLSFVRGTELWNTNGKREICSSSPLFPVMLLFHHTSNSSKKQEILVKSVPARVVFRCRFKPRKDVPKQERG